MKLAPGTQLGPYEIRSLLGAGGMGEVYRARDTRLNRFVAIKVLPEEASVDRARLDRFEREALSASALNHPNIVTVHDIGQYGSSPFIAMELVEGKTLRQILSSGPLPVKTLLNIATQLSEGLDCAHEAGIVHRDLKPENIVVNKNGLVKILDFGLAKLAEFKGASKDWSQAPTSGPKTASGILLGTVGYMSPEQANGQTADFRSDQFSLGTIFYEMATGHSPFHRKTAAETLVAILREEPEAVEHLNTEVPASFAQLIRRCLSKEADERYASTHDLVHDLRHLKEQWPTMQTSPPSVPLKKTRTRFFLIAANALLLLTVLAALVWQFKIRRENASTESPLDASIAVLPFNTLGAQNQEEYFSDGMTEALITQLARIQGMKVIARNSSFQYKGRNVDIREIGKELDVNYVLEGSVQRSADRIRVNVQLNNVQTGYHLWAEQYDRNAVDLFGVQDDISRNIASALKLALPELAAPQEKRPTENLQAYDSYLRGKYLLHSKRQVQGWSVADHWDEAISHLGKAIALDPQFALAHAELGRAYRQKYFYIEPRKDWEEKAYVEIEKAIALDPDLAEAYAARGRLTWTRQNDYPHAKAAQDYRKAIALDPNMSEAYAYLGGIYNHVGLVEEALQQCNTALKLDPTNTLARGNRRMALFFQQEYREAFLATQQVSEDRIWGALSLLYLGDVRKSGDQLKELLEKEPEPGAMIGSWDASFVHSAYALLLAKTGNISEAEKHIRMTIEKDRGLGHFHHSEYNIALSYALMGKTVPALEWLQKTSDHGLSCYPFFANDPHLENLHGNPDFEAFLEKMKQQMEHYRRELLTD